MAGQNGCQGEKTSTSLDTFAEWREAVGLDAVSTARLGFNAYSR
jgi:hypothetical protein